METSKDESGEIFDQDKLLRGLIFKSLRQDAKALATIQL